MYDKRIMAALQAAYKAAEESHDMLHGEPVSIRPLNEYLTWLRAMMRMLRGEPVGIERDNKEEDNA
jgi:hypothetical protein